MGKQVVHDQVNFPVKRAHPGDRVAFHDRKVPIIDIEKSAGKVDVYGVLFDACYVDARDQSLEQMHDATTAHAEDDRAPGRGRREQGRPRKGIPNAPGKHLTRVVLRVERAIRIKSTRSACLVDPITRAVYDFVKEDYQRGSEDRVGDADIGESKHYLRFRRNPCGFGGAPGLPQDIGETD